MGQLRQEDLPSNGFQSDVSFFPQQRKLGVSAKLGTGALWGSHPVRFPEVPRFRVKVPKVPSEGSEVPSKGSANLGTPMALPLNLPNMLVRKVRSGT